MRVTMFWDFGSAVSSQRQAAADHVKKSASGPAATEATAGSQAAAAGIGKLLEMPKKTLR